MIAGRVPQFAIMAVTISISSICFSLPSLADDIGSSSAGASGADSLEKKEKLEGHLQSEATTLEGDLKTLNTTLRHMKRGALDMYAETQRQEMAVVGEPDAIGPILIPAMPNPSGMLPVGGFLPPRKKWLDYSLSQINSLQIVAAETLPSLVLPDDASDDEKKQLKTLKDNFAAVSQDIKGLTQVTQGPKLDNNAIAQQATLLYNHVDWMDKACKKLYEEAKKDTRLHTKNEKELEKEIKKEGKGK